MYDHTAVLILALDTTTRAGSVSVTRGATVLAVVEGDASRTHGERLPVEIENALRDAGVERQALELLAVASGPGAFTGLRIGLAAIQGLAMVLERPVVAVSALDALACATWTESAEASSLVVWMDAQRGEVFSAQYAPAPDDGNTLWQPLAPPLVGRPGAILESLPGALTDNGVFVGDGAVLHQSAIDAWSHGRGRIVRPPAALAPFIARLGGRLAARGAAGPPHALQPLYVRRPDAEVERLRKTLP